MESIVVALITGAATVLAVIITNSRSSREMDAKLDKSQAITETKLDALTEEVRKHNEFAQKIPTIEAKVEILDRRVTVLENKV